mmetsp:Transcript_4975/g.12379  ORF Transcript_4975/g.12379 Transcript_4975/m.12379 type:complete len:183 (-) Transcript_4975:30-578(-)
MTLKYFLLVNKQGQTRLSQYYQYVPLGVRTIMEADIVRQCLARAETQVGDSVVLPLLPSVPFFFNLLFHSSDRLLTSFPCNQCSFMKYEDYKVVYRRYASLFFIVGCDLDENELALLEFIHQVVETMDRYFESVCELDIMFNLDKAHMILDEIVMNGEIVETNQVNILNPIYLIDSTIEGDR